MDDSLGSASKRSTKVGTKEIKKRSDVWGHFVCRNTPSGRKAKCNYCDEIYTAEQGTSQLRRHLESKHPDKYACSSDNFFDQEISRKLLTQLITHGGMPIHFVENQFFLEWVHSLQPMYIPDKMENLKVHVIKYFTHQKSRLQLELQKSAHINLTFHTLNSRQYKYLAITAHHINDCFELINVMIGFKQLPPDYTPIHLKSVLDKCFNDWMIGNNILSCTSSTHIITNLTAALHPLSKNIIFIQCCSEVINGMVRHCLSVIYRAVESIRRIVRSLKIRYNQGALGTQHSLVNSIPLDDVSRWDSTLRMLDAALSYTKDLDNYASDDLLKEYPDVDMPSADEWRRVSSVVKYMQTFYDAINLFSNCNDTPANLYLETLLGILDVISDKNSGSDEILNNLSIAMQNELKHYLAHNHLLPLVASVLDPSKNICFVEFFEKDSNVRVKTDFKSSLKRLFNSYQSKADQNHTANMVREGYNTEEANAANSGQKTVEQRFSQFKKQKMNDPTLSELDTYFKESVDGNENFNVRYWWKNNSFRYPVLSGMVKDFLALKMFTLPSEYAFCTDGQIVDYVDDATMNPEIVEALVCCRHWGKSSFDDNFSSQSCSNSSVLMAE